MIVGFKMTFLTSFWNLQGILRLFGGSKAREPDCKMQMMKMKEDALIPEMIIRLGRFLE